MASVFFFSVVIFSLIHLGVVGIFIMEHSKNYVALDTSPLGEKVHPPAKIEILRKSIDNHIFMMHHNFMSTCIIPRYR